MSFSIKTLSYLNWKWCNLFTFYTSLYKDDIIKSIFPCENILYHRAISKWTQQCHSRLEMPYFRKVAKMHMRPSDEALLRFPEFTFYSIIIRRCSNEKCYKNVTQKSWWSHGKYFKASFSSPEISISLFYRRNQFRADSWCGNIYAPYTVLGTRKWIMLSCFVNLTLIS